MTDVAHVPCNGCTACCRDTRVVLCAEDDQTLAAHDEQWGTDDLKRSGRVLDRKPDGACVYLGDAGCMVYDRRPAMCRLFDCRVHVARPWLKRHGLGERPPNNPGTNPVLAAGLALLLAGCAGQHSPTAPFRCDARGYAHAVDQSNQQHRIEALTANLRLQDLRFRAQRGEQWLDPDKLARAEVCP